MSSRNASCAIVGAGDYIGSAIARKFASEGYTVFAGRRNGDKLEPLRAEIEAAGGTLVPISMDAREEKSVTDFLNAANEAAPLEIVISNPGANVNYPLLGTTERVGKAEWGARLASSSLHRVAFVAKQMQSAMKEQMH